MNKIIFQITLIITTLVLISSCSLNKEPGNTLVVNFNNNECILQSQKIVTAGQVKVTMNVKNMKNDAGLVILTLDPGKTIDDLRGLSPDADQPAWSQRVGEAPRHVKNGEDLSFNVNLTQGPVFLVCFNGPPDRSIGVLGPIEVAK